MEEWKERPGQSARRVSTGVSRGEGVGEADVQSGEGGGVRQDVEGDSRAAARGWRVSLSLAACLGI